jgi:hypothetical protein
MKIFDGELTQAQIDAGLAVMNGQFEGLKVIKALRAAGAKNCMSGAEALIGRELRLGRIRRITRGIYEQC